MKAADLAELNRYRAARRAVGMLTALQTGEGWLLLPEGEGPPHPLPPEFAAEAFRSGKSALIEHAGETYFLNVHPPPPRLVLIGAVHISQSLVRLAREVAFECTIIDPRTAFATQTRFPGATVIAQWPQDALPGLALDRFTALAALTHDPKIDDPALHAAICVGCFYVGALGSRKTNAARRERLAALGVSALRLDAIHAPIGLDIGAASPAEIAVAVLAEVIAALRGARRG